MSKVKGKHLLNGNARIIKQEDGFTGPEDYSIPPDGSGWLNEPVPNFYQHNNEKIIQANCDNNAMIRIGRDRFDERSLEDKSRKSIPSVSPTQRYADSGFSAFDGAGAIDLVVGRGAPWPFDSGISQTQAPMYTTKVSEDYTGVIPTLASEQDPRPHPMIFMDAARIYISQMCYPDKYFKISNPTRSGTIDKNPCSAIVIKGDKIRMHARRDVKIVAGGDKGDKKTAQIDSNGYPIRDDQGRIYLMKNENASCTPAVRGDKMVELATKILRAQKNIIVILNNIIVNQMEFNSILGTSFYVSAAGSTATNPVNQQAAVKSIGSYVTDIMNSYFEAIYNIPMDELTACTPAGADSILSKHVFIS